MYDVARDDNRNGDRVGLLQTVLLLAAVPAAIWIWRRNRKLALAILAAALAGLLLFFLLTPWSDWLWRIGGDVTARLLYRTRLMGAEALAAAVAGGLSVAALPSRLHRWVAGGLAAVLLLAAFPSLYVQYQHAYASFAPPVDKTDVRAMEIRHGGTALTAFGEFEPAWRTVPFDEALQGQLGADFDPARRPFANAPGEIAVQSAQVRNQSWDLGLSAPQAVTATLNLLYYPRWNAQLDGQPVSLSPQPETGYVQVSIPAGAARASLALRANDRRVGGPDHQRVSLRCAMCRGRACARATQALPRGTEAIQAADAYRYTIAVPVLLGLTALLVFKFAVLDPYTTWFRCVSTPERVCGAQSTVNVAFQGAPRLRGYSVDSYDLPAGGELRLRLYWEAQEGNDRPLAAFVHVRNASPEQAASPYSEYGVWAQQERSSWGVLKSTELVPGKLYEDGYSLKLPAGYSSRRILSGGRVVRPGDGRADRRGARDRAAAAAHPVAFGAAAKPAGDPPMTLPASPARGGSDSSTDAGADASRSVFPLRLRWLIAAGPALVFAVILIRTAWMSDDAYITLRTVDNFVHGYGLTWNVAERVQSYTHPLWMFLLSAVYFVTREAYYSTMALGAVVSLAALILLVRFVAVSALVRARSGALP